LIAVAWGLCLFGLPARAEAPRAQGYYVGAFYGLELKTGVAVLGSDPTRDRSPLNGIRPLIAISARVATLMSLLDFDLSVAFAALGGTTAVGREETLHTRIGVEMRLHPFFLSHLQGNWLKSGVYLAFGGGLDLLSSSPEGGLPGKSRTDAGVAIAWGFGLDVPLSAMNTADPSVWLGLGYRMRFVGFPGAPPGLGDRDGHDLFVNLSVRWHGLDFARVPRPPELNDADR